MALCAYCKKVEIAWHQGADRKWVAYTAQLDGAGGVVRRDVRDGLRTVRRPVPDLGRKHYPHGECPAWTPERARERIRSSPRSPRPPLDPRPPSDGVISFGIDVDVKAGESCTAPAESPAPSSITPPITSDAVNISLEGRAAWQRAEELIRCNVMPTRVLLWGPPGTGKTELPWRVAQAAGWGHVYQLMTEETPATELLGHLVVQAGSTVWWDGTLGRAIRASHAGHVVLVIDEIARASADAMSACLLALTNPESLRLPLRTGEIIEPKREHWHVVCTSNDDPATLPAALADRLHLSVRVTEPHPDLVASLTTTHARRLATSRSREYSIRALLTFDRLVNSGMTVAKAAQLTWEPETAKSFMDAVSIAEKTEETEVAKAAEKRGSK